MKNKKRNSRQGKKSRPAEKQRPAEKPGQKAGPAEKPEPAEKPGKKPGLTEKPGQKSKPAEEAKTADLAESAVGAGSTAEKNPAGEMVSEKAVMYVPAKAGPAGKKKRNRLRTAVRIAYTLFLVAYVIFVLLDTFVIPSNIILAVRGVSDLSDRGRVVITESTYEDNHIRIDIRTDRIENTTVYIADVQISDASLLKTGLAGDAFGRNLAEVTSSIAERNEAVFAVNGDYYGFRAKGYVLRNGYLYRSVSNTKYPYGEDLVIWEDGSFEIIEEGAFTAQELADLGAQQIFSFGPALVNHGEVQVVEGEEVERAQITNPRTAIGIVEPLHYIMVVSDGRTKESRGLSLYSLAGLMQDLGCTIAYNLDGGGSSTIWFNGKVLNKPTTYGDVFEERVISDIVYIGY